MDVRSEILDYITRKEKTGALLITGKWGCGKSYLVKEISKELNATKKAAVAVISLFGLDSVTAINKRVKDEYTGFILGSLGKKVRKASKGIATVAKDGLNVASIATVGTPGLSAASQGLSSILSYDLFSLIDVKNTVGKDEKEREFIIAFDDLERSTLDKKVLLGTINEFVENKGIKVIIIADEEKITGEDYKEYKEKLISRTIRLSDNYDSIIECIVNEYAETAAGYKQFLQANLDLIKQVFFESGSHNLRTLKTGLADFERMYEAWAETDIATDNMKWALYTFLAEFFKSKEPKEEEDNKDKGYLFLGMNKEKYANKGKNDSEFSAFWSWIYENEWDKKSFINQIKRKYVKEEDTPYYRFIWYPFFNMQQSDVDEGLPMALEYAYNGELSRGDLVSLLTKLYYLKQYSIALPSEVDYSRIEEGLKSRIAKIKNGTVVEPECHTFADSNQLEHEALPINEMIERLGDQIVAWKNRWTYIDFLLNDPSSINYKSRGLCIDEFDDEMLSVFVNVYSKANNAVKREFAISLLNLSFDSNSYSTKGSRAKSRDTFNQLVEWLDSQKSDDCFTMLQYKQFIDAIKESKLMKTSE